MSTQQAQLTTFTVPENKGRTSSLIHTIAQYLYHWPLFIVVITFSFTLAYLYVRRLKPIYEVKAMLLIQDEKKTPDQQSALQELNLSSSHKIIENEIEILKSKELISRVVNELDLSIIYLMKDKFNTVDLYKVAPIKFILLKPVVGFEQEEINIIIKDENTFMLVMADGTEKEFPFNRIFRNNFGTWKLSPENDIGAYRGKEIKILVADAEQTALSYQQRIDAGLLNKLATAVVLTTSDEVPQRGKDVLNQLISNYNEADKMQKNQETQSTIDFIDQRLSSLRGELTAAEKGIAGFKSSRGLTDIGADSKISLENMQANDTRINEVNVQISIIEGIEKYLGSDQNSGKVPSALGINDLALSGLIDKLSQLQLQRDKLLATTPENNPYFDPLNRQIQSTRAAIKENVSNIKSSLFSTRDKLQSYNSRFESSIRNMPTQEREYISIKRQQASKENVYTYLLQKREEVSVSYASSLSNEHIIDAAYAVPARGFKKMVTYAGALFLGFGFPAGLIFIRNMIKERIIDLREINDVIDIPVIGQIELSDNKNPIAINDTNISAISEQIRALRTKLYHLYQQKSSGRVTLVTSSVSGEGKSFVSSNLAVAMAVSGRKTLIIELDMRKPKITSIFSLSKGHAGISDFLSRKISEKDVIQQHQSIHSLYFISSGSAVNNPSELLETENLVNLISSLRNTYDDIIIDSPPVHLVPDGIILSRLSDVTLYVIRQGFTERTELSFIKELYDQKQLSNLRFVFNGISKVKYGYGYHYNYGYYNQGKKNKPLNFLFSNFSNRFILD